MNFSSIQFKLAGDEGTSNPLSHRLHPHGESCRRASLVHSRTGQKWRNHVSEAGKFYEDLCEVMGRGTGLRGRENKLRTKVTIIITQIVLLSEGLGYIEGVVSHLRAAQR